jgi:hypothetical protein
MRAIPFRVVCLLGMNDADYPRRASHSDFDVLAAPGMQRPGDRARRDDDRQLMLEALMSARDVLYISWAGRSVRDNTEQPPSVLVSQLRDHLVAGWGAHAVKALTTEHPLQPFSRRYFEAPVGVDARATTDPQADTAVPAGADPAQRAPALFTHAHEWRDMHVQSQERPLQSEQAQGGFLVDGLDDLQKAEHLEFDSQALEAFLIEKGGQAPCVWVPGGTAPAAGCPAALAQTMPARTMVARRAAKSLSTKSPNAWPVSSAGVQLFLVSASCQALVLVALVLTTLLGWSAIVGTGLLQVVLLGCAHALPRGCTARMRAPPPAARGGSTARRARTGSQYRRPPPPLSGGLRSSPCHPDSGRGGPACRSPPGA